MTKFFKDVILGLSSISPQVQEDLNNVVKVVANYVFWDPYDPIVEDLVKTIRTNGINDDVGVSTTSTFDNAPTSNQPI